MKKDTNEVKTLLRDIEKLRKANETLKKQLNAVKASKSIYMLEITKRTENGERFAYEKKFYTTKADAKTDLEYEYFQATGQKCDKHSDSAVYDAEDGSLYIRLEITKPNVL